MQISLTVVGGVHNGRLIPIGVPEFLIGRDPGCHLKPASNDVSRHHCAIVLRDGRVFLRDYGSRNGTVLNQRMLVRGELQLEDGDVIEVGPLTFRLNLALLAEPTPEARTDTPHEVDVFGGEQEAEGTPDDTVLASKTDRPSPPAAKPRDAHELLCE